MREKCPTQKLSFASRRRRKKCFSFVFDESLFRVNTRLRKKTFIIKSYFLSFHFLSKKIFSVDFVSKSLHSSSEQYWANSLYFIYSNSNSRFMFNRYTSDIQNTTRITLIKMYIFYIKMIGKESLL